ncbi:MAG: flavodoxin [Clostridia bacterium]|nr:flavodoxin [Clostridia bacterium]
MSESLKTAVVFYSMSGNVKFVAGKIAESLGADVIELVPEKAYPDKGFRKFFWGGKSAVMKETPALAGLNFDPDKYDRVIIGTPVWAGTMAPPVRSFITGYKDALKTKKLAFFACCSGTDAAKAIEKTRALAEAPESCPSAFFTDPLTRPDEKNDALLSEFIKALGD